MALALLADSPGKIVPVSAGVLIVLPFTTKILQLETSSKYVSVFASKYTTSAIIQNQAELLDIQVSGSCDASAMQVSKSQAVAMQVCLGSLRLPTIAVPALPLGTTTLCLANCVPVFASRYTTLQPRNRIIHIIIFSSQPTAMRVDWQRVTACKHSGFLSHK